MRYQKGDSNQDLYHDSSVCGEKGWTGCCHESPMGTTNLPPCHDSGSLSRDIEGSCQSEPQGCQPLEPCPPQSYCPPQQSCNKPRRRVEVSHVQPICPPPVKIHRRPLQQYRPPLHCEEPGCCGKPRRRVDQCPVEDARPPVILHPLPLQHRCPCSPCCCPPVQHCRPAAVPLPQHPSQHQQKKVTLLPPCLQKK
ncbi:uncharacterized protein LOC134170451 [Pezoporus occidentalis]|uniref:uncharacterized protein LOC134170451 n=1 Tax=Pezoporus occidentalis TaxID=407982 RepID=UPI002F908CFA